MTRSVRTIVALAAAVFLSRCAGCTSEEDTSCPSGQERCGGFCRDPASYATDPANCGACGNACATGATCVAGTCECPAGEEVCAGACVDPATYATDPANCGACGNACGVGTCAAGVCDCGAFIACPAPLPRCVDGLEDPRNCGTDAAAACGNVCPLTNDVCDAGTCTCPATLPDTCGSTCVDLASDESHCGACPTTCATGATCTSGVCQCPTGQSVCDGACVNRSTDEAHCGTCGWVCASGATCTTGACTCPSEQPLVCGVPGAGGSCCAGDGCCGDGTSCQTAHWNGLSANYYDCGALDQHTLEQARLAALSWAPPGQGQTVEVGLQCGFCLCRQTASQAAVWCYAGSPLKGFVAVTGSGNCLAAFCPSGVNGVAWH